MGLVDEEEEKRVLEVANKAQQAFWEEVATLYPEIDSGDFSPGNTIMFDEQCIYAVREWVRGNKKE